MKDKRRQVTQALVRELLDYDPTTGVLVWRVRSSKWFDNDDHRCAVWNARFSGKVAGSINAHGYVVTSVLGYRHPAHCLIWLWMTGEWPKGEIDHGDHDRTNNRWLNLSDAGALANRKNKRLYASNSSGVPGVAWENSAGKWRARINVNGQTKHLGLFEDMPAAVAARKAAETKFGFHKNHGGV